MKYCIFVRGKKVSVSEEVYKGYWKLVNHQKYLNRKDRKFGVLKRLFHQTNLNKLLD